MALPPRSCSDITVNPNYTSRHDVSEIMEATHLAKVAAAHYEESAAKRADTASGRVLAQADMIRAQSFIWSAEFHSHSICPRVQHLNAHSQHQKNQLKRLEQMRAELLGSGFIEMIKIHGFAGVFAYAFTMYSPRFTKAGPLPGHSCGISHFPPLKKEKKPTDL